MFIIGVSGTATSPPVGYALTLPIFVSSLFTRSSEGNAQATSVFAGTVRVVVSASVTVMSGPVPVALLAISCV